MERQLHLASKLEVPAELGLDGKTVKAKSRTVELPGMSNRAVRYRTLSADKVGAIDAEVAKICGPDATGRELRNVSLMHYLYEMVYQVSPPTDDPMKLKKEQWAATDSVSFQIAGSSLSWSKLFTPKDTIMLQSEFSKWHEMSVAQVEMLSGKSIPVATED